MRVAELMSRSVRCCSAEDELDHAARLLWEGDCGALPVVDERSRVVGVITDRDICMAAYTQGLPLKALRVGQAMSASAATCTPADSIAAAHEVLRRQRVHRLPVVEPDGKLVGMLSVNDLLRAAVATPQGDVRTAECREVVTTLARIGAPRTAGELVPAAPAPAGGKPNPSAGPRVGSLAARQADPEC